MNKPNIGISLGCILLALLAACAAPAGPVPTAGVSPLPATALPSATTAPTSTEVPPPTAVPPVPDFAHIIVILFENHEFDVVIDNHQMPNYNGLAERYSLLTQYYAVTHPSLPNYIALFGGDTFGITSDCSKCFVNAPSLPDQLEATGKTWKAYLEDMPSPCYIGDTATYVQKHDPFIYFDPIRLDAARCGRSVVPLTQLSGDLASGAFPDFAFIMPNICNSAHDEYINPACSVKTADEWLGNMVYELQTDLDPTGESYLIAVTWDEGQGNHSCCGLPKDAGGRVATLLISPQAKAGFQDPTPYTHYSLLKTIEAAWGLPYLGHAADANNALIAAPWK
ncbi:MAG TPA: alkaline phosphatase family protein [Anaerolineales bacterium]|nr:alkaline phosphatase family protein [Anaerolineales bacterium]